MALKREPFDDFHLHLLLKFALICINLHVNAATVLYPTSFVDLHNAATVLYRFALTLNYFYLDI